MKDSRYRHIQITVATVCILIGFFVWQGNRIRSDRLIPSLQVYGGSLSEYEISVLESMNRDLERTDKILSAGPQKISFLNHERDCVEYGFAYGTLWKNDSACLLGVRAFHLEYRDQYGNLLTRCDKKLHSIKTVSYVIRLGVEQNNVITSFKTRIKSPDPWTAGRDKATLARNQKVSL